MGYKSKCLDKHSSRNRRERFIPSSGMVLILSVENFCKRVQGMTCPSSIGSSSIMSKSPGLSAVVPEEAPAGPEFIRICRSRIAQHCNTPRRFPWHRLVKAAEKAMKRVKPDDKGLLHPRYDDLCLESHISKGTLERALAFMNAVILYHEAEEFL
jgi:hypothetical protein